MVELRAYPGTGIRKKRRREGVNIMTKTMNIAALDIGYHNLKGSKTTAKSIAELRNKIVNPNESDAELELFLLPAGACPSRTLPHSLNEDVGGEEITLNGEKWRGGIDFGLTPNINKDYSEGYKHTSEWKALLLTGLKRLNTSVIDCLVMGLPCSEYYETDDAIDDIVKLAKGTHKIDDNTEVEVKKVIVVPQPLGSFHGYYLSVDDEKTRGLLQKAITVVCDFGYGTFDWVVIKKGAHVLHQSAGSSGDSVRAVCRETERLLLEENSKYNIAVNEVEGCIRSDDWEVFVNGDIINIKPFFVKAADNVGKSGFKRLRTSLTASNVEPQLCILTAGGADIFKEIALAESGANKLLTSVYGIYLNVFGYLYEALKESEQEDK